ncbi:MAG TPA: tail fiber domain-containing protein [Thermoanaerobaculia bacterium]|nr:tail fiber domain-containing protein [Thermoanaerobaculia bacterium]
MTTRARLLLVVVIACAAFAGPLVAEDALPEAPTLVTSPMPFIGITPCRVADTRDSNQPPGYGPPSLGAGVPRAFTMTGRCGIPAGAQAVSLNVTVVNATGLGYVLLYPTGQPQPGVSTLNFVSGLTVANAAIVPLGQSGQITVAAAVSATDFIIDTNGYFGPSAVDVSDTFLGVSAGNAAMTGVDNTGIGYGAFQQNTSGTVNTAIGSYAMLNNTAGSDNTALGVSALRNNTTGNNNSALGAGALASNSTGSNNVAVGAQALAGNVGGSGNTAVGYQALLSSTGSNNTALGAQAGFNLTAGDNNVYLGSVGAASESGVMRIGDPGLHTKFFLAGVFGVVPSGPGAVPVYVDSTSHVGTIASSARFKEDVSDMGEASRGIFNLRPVTFHYKTPADDRTQYGLIAEEVQEVLPDLVVADDGGQPEAVLYHELPAMLVNEWQRQRRELAQLEGEGRDLVFPADEGLDALSARIARLESAPGESSAAPAPQPVR